MERISAACAMEWSIELEKALRSKKPGQAVKAIQQIGSRLQQWNREPKPTMAVYNMFGLVLGEDRLFANTIILRLADAFRLGDKDTRLSVVRVFLSVFRNNDKEKKGKRYEGILSKARIHNQMELLKRVKIVFDTGDVESRALALILFGCWADFAKESAHIRYLLLSSLVSSEILEVKAALFAAGCFCVLAADFASVVLEMLLNILISPNTSVAVRLAGVRVFAKMGCSYSIANRAHKIGLQLVLDSSEDDFLVSLLVSLSKLAAKSTLLLSEQVDLLLLFLSREKTLMLQATALRCLNFIFKKGICHSSVSTHAIRTLLRTIDETELPSAMKCEALQILQTLVYGLPELSCDKMLDFTILLNIIEKAAQSPVMSESMLAIQILVDASKRLGERRQVGSDGDCFFSLPTRIISVIMDRMILMFKPLLDVSQNNSKVFQEFQSLLNLLLFLVGEHPDLGVLVLQKVGSFIECLLDMHDNVMTTKQEGVSVHELVDFRGQKSMYISLNLVHNVLKFSVTCIENLNEVSAITTEIHEQVKFLVEQVQSCKLFDRYIYIIYSVLLHSQNICGCVVKKNEEPCRVGRNLGNSLCNLSGEHEIFSLELVEKMLIERDNWPVYKAGIYTAYQGAWITAAFIFGQLIGKVQSDSCSYWLKALAQFAESEGKILLFLLPILRSKLMDWLKMKEFGITFFGDSLDEIGQVAVGNISEPSSTKLLVGVYHGLYYSGETLKSIAILEKSCCFQRWFLALRGKVLRTVVHVLKVLGTIPLAQCSISNNVQVDTSVTVECLDCLRKITQTSFQLKSLAQEFDLIAMSFIGMDRRSSKIISALALSCSLLAFTIGFSLFISKLPDYEILAPCDLQSSTNYLQGMLIQNLASRLWLIDQEICSNLFLLLEVNGKSKNCFDLQPRNQILNSGGEVRDILNVCKYAVSGIVGLQNETRGVHNEEILFHIIKDGFQLVLKTITEWMHIPFRIPKYFFKLRPCIGSELIVISGDSRNSNELTVLQGFHLSINLCLQLRNVPMNLAVRMTKLYCILCSSASFQEPKSSGEARGQMQLDYDDWEMSSMIAMNERLWHQVIDRAKKTDNCKRGRDYDASSDDGTVYRFVCFELNDRGQGFSSCLLDVSDFPVGSYRIKWHSCCIDYRGSYWSLLPLNAGPVFTIKKPSAVD
ncbi:uncharacterized protein LOC110660225 isoform X2 [Hevea brasiliensis]|nr:uncharacterized protein LOC110660225 isoform X2 [Hevea brasiliensis]